MVWSQEREAERPPLSVILPRLYLGAESDVTEDGLASLGISYVLSVSRCSPQPCFLPHSRYLRIPIDDSLRDDLLPWIPQALHFIDAAMSSGASVLVHCAAGISRSPALAVAYIMYSLGMDLDHAYRFVKERRPSISPNFNFLGQLQHFQGTLSLKASGGDLLFRQLDSRLPSAGDRVRRTLVSRNMNEEADRVPGGPAEGQQGHRQQRDHKEETRQRRCHSSGRGSQQLFLSGNLRTLRLTLSEKDSGLCEAPAPSASEPVEPAAEPARLQLPAGSTASLVEKRKSLTLSLTPLGSCPLIPAGSGQQAGGATASKSARDGEGTQSHAGDSLREGKEQGPLSPFSFTLSKLLGWGERVLLGGALVHTVRMGQPALPYRC